MTDLFGVGGRQLLAHLCTTDARFHSAYGQRLESLVVLVDAFDSEIAELTDSIAHLFRNHAGYRAIQQVAGVGPSWPRCSSPRSATSIVSVSPPSVLVGRAHPTAARSDAHLGAGPSPRWHVGRGVGSELRQSVWR